MIDTVYYRVVYIRQRQNILALSCIVDSQLTVPSLRSKGLAQLDTCQLANVHV